MVISQNPMYPYVDTETVEGILEAFQKNVNFWYPTLSQSQMEKVRGVLEGGVPADESVLCCLTLLIMALGCVSQAATSLREAENHGEVEEEKQWRIRRAKMGNVYFQLALKKLHIVHLDVSSESTQCLFFTTYVFSPKAFFFLITNIRESVPGIPREASPGLGLSQRHGSKMHAPPRILPQRAR